MSHSKQEEEEAPHLHYKKKLHALRVELVKLQRHVIRKDLPILAVFEGRDAAGKDGDQANHQAPEPARDAGGRPRQAVQPR